MISKEQAKMLSDAVDLVGANHGTPLPEMIYPLLIAMANNHFSAGGNARQQWLKNLRALGETCLTVEKLANNK
jgi:hypothetical protein